MAIHPTAGYIKCCIMIGLIFHRGTDVNKSSEKNA